MEIGREGLQSRILDRETDGEMIEALPTAVLQTELGVDGIVEVAADTGSPDAPGLGLQI